MSGTQYVVMERVGVGGLCEIFRAQQRSAGGFEKVVALKRLLPEHAGNPERVQALVEEAKQAALLCHGNIAQVIDLVEQPEGWAVVLEFVPGIDLARLTRLFMEHDRRLDLPECLHIIREILVALDYLHHAAGPDGQPTELVHGDIAPGNVMISLSGEVKLVDFGMLTVRSSLSAPSGGKVRYSPPERAEGGPRGVSGDLYSTGLILWELLAGTRVYDGMGLEELVHAVNQGTIPPVEVWRPEVPPVVAAILLRSLAKDPARRFPSAADFLRALGQAEVPWDPAGSRKVLAALVQRLRATSAAITPVQALPTANPPTLEEILDTDYR